MFLRGRLQRSLITLLVLLIVTPQVLLRPCCCAEERIATATTAGQPAEERTLPPCCLKRLQAAQAAAADAQSKPTDTRPGVHDSGRCGCRVANQVARSNRTVFNSLLLRHVVAWMSQQINHVEAGTLTPSTVLTTTADSLFPEWGSESCVRLCRWVV
jgi:hypothetical protein